MCETLEGTYHLEVQEQLQVQQEQDKQDKPTQLLHHQNAILRYMSETCLSNRPIRKLDF